MPSNNGEATACSAAMRARSTPDALAEPIIAIPISPITVRTSSKSTLTRPGKLMISAIPPTALRRTLSAALNASSIDTSSPRTSISLSLRITIRESTLACSSAIPSSAILSRLPSKPNGLVTTATVRMPSSRATLATIGPAPVPVPPPMPAVMKTILAPLSASAICSRSSSAALRPASGFAPAPSPVLPRRIFLCATLRCSACESVLAARNSTPITPSRIM